MWDGQRSNSFLSWEYSEVSNQGIALEMSLKVQSSQGIIYKIYWHLFYGLIRVHPLIVIDLIALAKLCFNQVVRISVLPHPAEDLSLKDLTSFAMGSWSWWPWWDNTSSTSSTYPWHSSTLPRFGAWNGQISEENCATEQIWIEKTGPLELIKKSERCAELCGRETIGKEIQNFLHFPPNSVCLVTNCSSCQALRFFLDLPCGCLRV